MYTRAYALYTEALEVFEEAMKGVPASPDLISCYEWWRALMYSLDADS